MFQFKQFTIHQDHTAMKVGTDGTLLGAWAPAQNGGHILDIGTGTGLIALMMAQRFPKTQITAIDIDPAAILQARENADASPFGTRITTLCCPLQEFVSSTKYDTIVSNPPFYDKALQSPDAQRSMARNTESLPFETLITAVRQLLNAQGLFSVIIPTPSVEEFCFTCWQHDLNLLTRTDVITKEGKPAKRTLLTFTLQKTATPTTQVLCLMGVDGDRTEEYRRLVGDFYIK